MKILNYFLVKIVFYFLKIPQLVILKFLLHNIPIV